MQPPMYLTRVKHDPSIVMMIWHTRLDLIQSCNKVLRKGRYAYACAYDEQVVSELEATGGPPGPSA